MYAQQVELGHMVGPFPVFGGDFTLISIVATRVCTPPVVHEDSFTILNVD